MIKYFCNLCKNEIKAGDFVVIQTKIAEQTKTVHLHKHCLNDIQKLCRGYYLEGIKPDDIDKSTTQSDKQDTKVSKKAKTGKAGTTEKIKVSDDDFNAALAELSNASEKVANVKENTVSADVHIEQFKINMSSLQETLTTSKPRDIVTVRRILLCLYKGISMSDISDMLNILYQKVAITKSKYACKEIARLHMKPERLFSRTCDIIDQYIKTGNTVAIANDLQTGEEKIEELIKFYTGF